MQPPTPPMTPFEEHITQSYQMLDLARFQSIMLHTSATFCFDRCLDTEELYTLMRTTHAPYTYRMHKDLEEKKCVQNCSAKWDVILQQAVRDTNDSAIAEVQSDAMMKMAQMMQQQ